MQQLDSEDWKDFRKEWALHRSEKRKLNTTLIYKFCVANSVNCETKTEYHFRLTREGFLPVDIFPTSGKVHVLRNGKQKYFKTDIIQFLLKHFS